MNDRPTSGLCGSSASLKLEHSKFGSRKTKSVSIFRACIRSEKKQELTNRRTSNIRANKRLRNNDPLTTRFREDICHDTVRIGDILCRSRDGMG